MSTRHRTAAAVSTSSIVVFAPRDRARTMARSVFPRRRNRLVIARTSAAFAQTFRETLVDAAIVDVGAAATVADETWRAAALAREFPSVPFFGLLPLRASDGPTLAQCAAYDFSDVLVEGVDDFVARDMVSRSSFTSRFARALHDPPTALALSTPLQQTTWRCVVARAGRGVRTESLAEALHVTREHLSLTFAADGGPNLKRIIDLVRLLAAAELAKNPGYDVRDVAKVLGFASPSHLSTTSQRIVGTKSSSLTRLRAVDLVERFSRGHGRSRGE
ncbi:MAG TPA: helix-turn-helix domain-containing protein [Gemmatimonadaceae bacterium]|nr:helix-turn-helix domain-containing protein [Gemmatimonadaceae bacterium]